MLNLDQREVSGLTKILKYVREHPDEFNDEDIEWTALFLESAIPADARRVVSEEDGI